MRIIGSGIRMAQVAALLGLAALAFGDEIPIDLSRVTATSITNIGACTNGSALRFNSVEPKPADAAFFFVRYAFTIAHDGAHRLVVDGPGPGTAWCSRFSYSIDGGKDQPVLRRQVLTPAPPAGPISHDQDAATLTAGAHTLEFRFYPDQRMRAMNRVDQDYVGHRIQISAARFVAVSAAAPLASARPADQRLALRPGESIALFGDSITEEALYGRHVARLLATAYPGDGITAYNAGISMNRTWEALARVETDVIALHPTWAVLAFGVNDCVHMPPEEFARHYDELVTRLEQAGIKVLCATPSGMSPEPDSKGAYFHTPDRARALDRTIVYEANAILAVAARHRCPCADVLGAFTRAGLARGDLMGSQWHPGDEGGRVFALELLRALGFSADDAARTGDPKDQRAWAALVKMLPPDYPAMNVTPLTPAQPARTGVAVSSYSRNAVFAFSTNGELIACVRVGHHPMGLAWSAQRNELYVTCEGSGRIDVIQLPGFTLAGSIALGDVYPVSIALSADERMAWTGNFFGSSVSEIDLAARKVKRTIPIGSIVEGVTVLPDGTLLAAARDGVAKVDVQAGNVTKRVKVSDYAASFFYADDRLGVIDTATWKMAVLNPDDLTVKATEDAPYAARAMALDGKQLWCGDCERGALVRVDLATHKSSALADVEFPMGVAVFRMAP